jgi:hypothetical protein
MPRTTNPMTPAQRTQRARIANADRWSRLPGDQRAAQTAPARAALRQKYRDQVDPDGVLPEAERERLARSARQADIERWALMASRARTAKAQTRRQAQAVALRACPECGSPPGERCGNRRPGPTPGRPHAARVELLGTTAGQ